MKFRTMISSKAAGLQGKDCSLEEAHMALLRPATSSDFPQIILGQYCPACATPMWLDFIEPACTAGYDLRTFECPRCQHAETVLVEDC
jgi:hypothetical protein